MISRPVRLTILAIVSALALSGCGFSPYKLPLPGGADLGSEPYTVKIAFRDVLDLVPQSAVRVNDIAVGKVTDIELEGWTALVTVKINRDAKLPDNAVATIRQTSLLGEKFVSLAPPSQGAVGALGNGDKIPLDRSGRNPEIEEVLGAASLLFNGGGLEKTNTIVRELNNAIGGNEPQIKELLTTTTTFIGQLDENKEALLTALEKVNRLAIATDDQSDAITGALDELPDALRVVNDQRDELVGLLQSLDKLGDVATGVIRESKADTVADLKALVPALKNLARAGDDLATGTQALLTFPFTDGFVGGNIATATGRCQDATGNQKAIKEGACFGDFANLSVSLDIGAEQLENILGGFDLRGLLSGKPSPAATPVPATDPAEPTAPATDPAAAAPAADLADLISKLLPGSQGLPSLGLPTRKPSTAKSTPRTPATAPGQAQVPVPAPAGATPAPAATSRAPAGFLCRLFGSCRAPVANAASADLSRLLVDPVVAP
ncbi:MCE family protein [Aeromicrobium wangtongii]|uniref:MCE family protein n=1 Tax=Aeromicrobium wangtongii TaxID=2969247 RepID=A0ABY5M4U4_9ACTN|nr:MCE family protein [Aeromicrobium wangtongii]MCD9198764.1 MCE family protein [Aeromicrobium wangtongii]UUP13193.1 MCE family protein [Aeromicrobium wangtongii]